MKKTPRKRTQTRRPPSDDAYYRYLRAAHRKVKKALAAGDPDSNPIYPEPLGEDRVTKYARDVTEGRTLAGPLVRLACARHLRDLETATTRGLTWDATAADRVAQFFSKFLWLNEDKRFHLELWQVFIIGSLFGWKQNDGSRRFRTAYIEIGKGNGKTPLAAGVGLYCLMMDNEQAAEVYAAAVTREQARILFTDAQRFVDTSPAMKKRLQQRVNNIAYVPTGSFLRPVSSEHRGLDGKRVHVALIDEIHEHPTALVVDKMRAGTKGRKQALIFEITNSGYDRTSVCWHHHEYSRQVLEGTTDNDAWFAYVCGLDEGDDPFTDEGCWRKANPNLGVSITERYLREQVQEAVGMPSKAGIVLRLNFCVWTQAYARWLDMGRWSGCGETVPDDELLGVPCYAGLDLGQSDDFSAFVLLWMLDDGRMVVRPRFWLPRSALEKYRQRPYDAWRRQGLLEVTDGDTTDYDRIEAAVLEECQRWGVRQLGYDKRFAEQMAIHLRAADVDAIDTPQGFFLTEAIKRFEDVVAEGQLRHGGHQILGWMASNAVVKFGPDGKRRLDKEKSGEKIDGIVAAVMALSRAIVQPVEAPSVYEERGVLML